MNSTSPSTTSTERPIYKARPASSSLAFGLFIVWTFLLIGRPQDYLLFLGYVRPILVITVATVLAIISSQGIPRIDELLKIREVRLIAIFYLLMFIGVPFAVHTRVALNFVIFLFPTTLLYFFASIILINSMQRMRLVIWSSVVGLLFSGLFYVFQTLESGVDLRAAMNQMYDPNDTAMVFATYVPLSLYILLSNLGGFKKSLALIAAFVATIGIILSKSRGGVLSLAFVVISLLLLKLPKIKLSFKILIIACVAAIGLYLSSTIEERFANMSSDYNLTEKGGRFHIWEQALTLLSENPLLGVGANCSHIAIGLYRAGLEDEDYKAWQVTHSSPLQIALETGIPGILMLVLVNVGALKNLRRCRRGRNDSLSLLAVFLELSLYGFWVAGLFLSHGYSVHLYLLLAASVCMLRMRERGEGEDMIEMVPIKGGPST